MLFCMPQTHAAKKHREHHSSSSESGCCKKINALAENINRTTTQDLIIDNTTLNVVNQINQTTRSDLAVDQEILEVVNHINTTTEEDLEIDQKILNILACSAPIHITQDMFTETSGFVIAEPGYYQLCEDIYFSPVTPINAITIASSDVVLDFKSHTLQQTNGDPTFLVEAIHVNRGLSNITIVGDQYALGQIRNFEFRGIDLEASKSITIANMLVTNDQQAIPTLYTGNVDLRPLWSSGIIFIDYDPLASYTGATWSSTAGTSAAITAISGNGTTVTYTAANSFVAGQAVTITGATTAAYNISNAVITTASPSQFTISSSATGASSTATATQSGPYMVTFTIPTQSVAPLANTPYKLSGFSNTATITNASGNGTTVTYTATNSFLPGQVITVTGVSPSAYNLANVIIDTASPTQFTIRNPATGAYASGGTATQTNSLNGAFLCTKSTNTTMTFAYPSNPGNFGSAAGTINNLNVISNRAAENVKVVNVEVSNCGFFGVTFSRVTGLIIDELRATNNASTGCWLGNFTPFTAPNAAALSIEPYIINAQITNSKFDNNGALNYAKVVNLPFPFALTPGLGAETNRCKNIEFKNCSFDSNFTILSLNSQVLDATNGIRSKGLDDDGSTEIGFSDCSFDNNFSTSPASSGGTVEGLHFSGSISNLIPNRNVTLENCTFDGNNIQYNPSVPASSSAQVRGLALFYVKGVYTSGCSANGNYISRYTPNADDTVQGFLTIGDRTVAVPGPNGTISNLNNEDVVYENCVALHNATTSGSVFGFSSVATSTTTTPRTNLLTGVVMRNCIAEGNTTADFISSGTGLASPAGIGFLIQPGTNTADRIVDAILLDGCIANRNGKVGSISGQRSSGYYISGNSTGGPDRNIVLQNCTASSNDGYGFLFGNAEKTFVKYCEANNNTLGGFVDLLDDSTSVLIKNSAIANGPNGLGPNYSGLSATTPIALWKPSETTSPFTFNNQLVPAFSLTGSFVGSGTTFTVTATSGIITPGMILTGGTVAYLGVPGPAPLSQGVGPKIIAQLTGTPGGIGTYVVDRAQSAGATATGLAVASLDPELDNIDIQN